MASRLVFLLLGVLAGCQVATQAFAWRYAYAPVLGPGWFSWDGGVVYAPWSILSWRSQFGEGAAASIGSCALLIPLCSVGGLGLGAAIAGSRSARRVRGWGGLAEARAAGLLARNGAVLGLLGRRVLATLDMRPTLVTGGTRSGKGRGHVAPTLLAWPHSVLVHDPKGELWTLSAGWRSRFSHTLWLAPRRPETARWNPLAEIQTGDGELAQVQRLVAILADPGGARDDEAIWDKAASEILEAVILHVLYTAEDADKTLLRVRDLLADLDETADVMSRSLHRAGAAGEPEIHPFIKTAVRGYAAMHDRFRTSVQGTARSYLKWLAGADVERTLSGSDFAMGDLMCADAPVSLYVQVAPADASALRPLVRLFFYAAAQALTTDEAADAAGRKKKHRLLMVMDEFPLLGRLAFFEKSLRLMSGFGIKAMFVAQSLQWFRYPQARVIFFDKGRSARAATLAIGGSWRALEPGGAVSLQPLARIDDLGERAWASEWLAEALRFAGLEPTPELRDQLWSALNALSAAPQDQRTLTVLCALVQNRAIAAALEPLTLKGPHGDLLDGADSRFAPTRFDTFELETLMATPSVTGPVLSALFHDLEAGFDGRPTLLILDEAWLFLEEGAFAAKIREWLKTLRKKRVSVIFATQSLDDVAASSIAATLIESCPTQVFLPNPRALEPASADLYRAFGLSRRQLELIAFAPPKRAYYWRQPQGRRLFELRLTGVALALCGAGSPEDQALIDAVMTRDGPAAFARGFLKAKGVQNVDDVLDAFGRSLAAE